MLKEIELSYSDKNEMLSVIKALANEGVDHCPKKAILMVYMF